MSHESLTPSVTIRLQSIAYEEMDPAQRAAWDDFWGELIRSVSHELCHPQLGPTSDTRDQHRANDAAVIEECTNDSPSE